VEAVDETPQEPWENDMIRESLLFGELGPDGGYFVVQRRVVPIKVALG
jgi:hypothetical protein